MSDAVTAREIAITRVYDAPREQVWKAWTEPERLAAWWGKRGWNAVLSSIKLDVRPGGAFRVTTISDEDGVEMTTEGVYREVVEPERLVLEEPSDDDWHGGAVSTVVLTDLGDGRTEMRFSTTVQTTRAIHEAARAGLGSAFDRLAEHLHPNPQEPA
jgi:uncharacterized protein YndB with AHSA1/START domain